MLTKRQNMLEVIRGGHPDRFVKAFEALGLIKENPFTLRDTRPKRGQMNVVNAWGVTRSWPENVPGSFPVHTPDKIVVKDIERWQDYVKAPNVVYDAQEWEPCIARAEAIDRNEQFVTASVAPGVLEQCHYLLEIQNCMMAFYEYPDEMHELIDCITQFELDYAREICRYMKPDALFHHDDWGSQTSTFLSPAMFREFIKPAFMKIYGYYREHGVQLIIHHSDSYAATLVPDMIDMGVDVWQGAMRSNNIPELIRQYGGKITIMSGIDSATVDFEGWTDAVVEQRVREACQENGKLFFIPCASIGGPMSTYPGVYDAVNRAIDKMTREMF